MLSTLLAAGTAGGLGCSSDPAGSVPASTAPDDAGTATGDDGGAGDAAGGCTSVPARPGTVITKSGAVTGEKVGTMWSWKGIPYAAPPVGDLRWKPPVEPACWNGEKTTTAFGPACPQATDGTTVSGNEDCLSLAVWAADGAKDAPVLVFIHGGSNLVGSASSHDGAELAARSGAVVVAMEYRLGALGFFAHPQLDAESPNKVSGNYGILDQRAALQWVQANIQGFGGDPKKVVLFGQSAGAEDTLVHIASPLSKGLFAAAIAESGGGGAPPLAKVENSMQAVVDGVGCGSAPDVLACMRALPAEQLAGLAAAHGPLEKGLKYGPTADGYVLTASPLQVFAAGQHNHVPIVLGTNSEETGVASPKITTEEEYETALTAQYGARATQLLTQYPASRFATPRQAYVHATTDVIWTCPIRGFARTLATHQTEPVFRYQFTWAAPGTVGAAFGASHGLELAFLFRDFSNIPGGSGFTPSAADLQLSEAMQGYWARMGSGSPNAPSAPAWPAYDASTDPYLDLGSTIEAKAGLSTADCDFIDSLVQP